MLDLRDIERIVDKYRTILLDKYHVKSLGIFGSYSRGEQTESSDLDIIVEFSQPVGWKFYSLKDFLEEILGKKVDLATKNSLREEFKQDILKTVIYV